MRQIFKDTAIEQEFLKKGYVVLPFCSEAEIDLIKEKLTALKPSDDYKGFQETFIKKQSFHITFFDSDLSYKKEIFRLTKETQRNFSDNLLSAYKCVQGNVFLKHPKSGFVYPHQNLTICDERRYRTLSFWLPLQHTSTANGTMCLIPGTQNDFLKYRNTHVYWPYTNYLSGHESQKYFTPVEVKKGEILIIDDRIVHYTPVNNSDHARWVLHSLWAPSESQIRYFNPVNDKVEIYNVADDFWQYHVPGKKIDRSVPDEIIENDELILSEAGLIRTLDAYTNTEG